MDILDFISVAIVALGGWNGYRTGFVKQITRVFGAVIAYVLSLWLRPYVAPAIRAFHLFPKQPQSGLLGLFLGDFSDAAAFAAVFLVTFLLLRYASGLVDALFSLPLLSTVNRLAGLLAGLILALLFVYVGTLIAHYVNNAQVQTQLNNSVIVQWMNQFHWTTSGFHV